MFNMLVIEDDALQCKQLVNIISSSISNIKLYSMSFNGEEALEIIKNSDIEIILMDLILPDISGIQILEYIEKNELVRLKKSIIIVSGEAYLHPNLYKNKYIKNSFQKPINFDKIIQSINEIIIDKNKRIDEMLIKNKIYKELNELNYNFSYIGTQYLCEIIYEIYVTEKTTKNLSKNVYPIISRKHSTTINTVKCNIFHATMNSYYDCDQNKLERYFGRRFLSKPTTMDVINKILDNIKK